MNAKRLNAMQCELDDARATDSGIAWESFECVLEELRSQVERADKKERELQLCLLAHESAHDLAREQARQRDHWMERYHKLREALVLRMQMDENDAFPKPISADLFNLYSVLK